MIRHIAITLILHFSFFILHSASAAYRPDAWTNAPLGICVTRCDCSTRGVYVEFETDVEPPYLVGVYRMAEIGLGRKFPIREVETESKSACITVDLATIPTVFVQVMTTGAVSRCSTNELARRELTPTEFRAWRAAIENAAPWTNDDPGKTFELANDNSMEIIEDYLLSGFIKTDATNLCFIASGRVAVTNDGFRLEPREYPFRIRNGRNDIGAGYRILMFEDLGVCQAQRAYSARTNMSDTVVIPCGFRALSSHNGYIYTSDWEGRRYFQCVTNRVDHIFMKGGR